MGANQTYRIHTHPLRSSQAFAPIDADALELFQAGFKFGIESLVIVRSAHRVMLDYCCGFLNYLRSLHIQTGDICSCAY